MFSETTVHAQLQEAAPAVHPSSPSPPSQLSFSSHRISCRDSTGRGACWTAGSLLSSLLQESSSWENGPPAEGLFSKQASQYPESGVSGVEEWGVEEVMYICGSAGNMNACWLELKLLVSKGFPHGGETGPFWLPGQ